VTVDGANPTSRELQAGRFELLSRMADDLAHEIKNPLHAMVINLEVLRRRVAAGQMESALERTAVLEQELRRVNELVHKLLLLIRPARDGVQLLDLDEVLDEIVPLLELQARVARVPFEYSPVGAPMRVPVQREALAYALLGLGREALAAATTDAPLALVGQVANGAVRLSITPVGSVRAGAIEVDGWPADAAVFIADQLLRQTGARAERQSANAKHAAAFCITLPLSGVA
jgi:two-component system, sporulation sensor kinase D